MRSSGILMHISSLPGPYGIGSLGREAYRFVDFLRNAKQRYWQILPVGPTGYGDSPYQTFCIFAGNHYLIDLDALVEAGLLRKEETTADQWSDRPDRVDYGCLFERRLPVLRKAFARFDRDDAAFAGFVEAERDWLEEYGLYMALKEHFSGQSWTMWPEPIRYRRPEAVKQYRREFQEEIEFHFFLQYEFFAQWKALRRYAYANGVSIIGDVPIYVPLDSSDVWSEPDYFQLDRERRPKFVAGVPPDYFSAGGQLWGNPLYDWERMKKDGYLWWIRRLQAAAGVFDVVRIDHFRGIESYWSVPYGDETARNGVWVKGPGMQLIRAIKRALPELRFIAEDLGFLTPAVIDLVKKSGFPGMKVLEFAFDSREPSDYLPHNYDRKCICYTGTHDNETLVQWAAATKPEDYAYAVRYLGKREEEPLAMAVIRAGMASVAELFIVQMQDWLGLGGEGRMNHPGIVDGNNWRWRATEEQFSDKLADSIGEMTALYGRGAR
ncbi:MAG: 4-alpha-glucanotransferase [Oscillospiraceae bacterium]|nr:4-alpha-glucanotransferase [Oscillospiraceae bacterium]